MNILEWWAMHREVVAVGQDNIDKVASVYAIEDFDPNPLPDEWANMTLKITIKKSPDLDFEDLSF